MRIKGRYEGVRVVAWLLQVLAWLVLVAGIVVAVWLLFSNTLPGLRFGGRNWTGVLLLPLVISWFIQLFLLSNVLLMLRDIEHSTRLNARAIEELLRLSRENAEMAAPATSASESKPLPPPPPASEI